MTRMWVIAVLTVGVVVACDRVPLTSPTGSTIALSVDRDTLPLNGQATVTAVVTESAGTPVQNGTTVTFQTSLGRTDPIEAQTVNGKATVTFLAGTVSGTAAISAFSGGARTGSGNSSSGGVSIKVGTAGVERVSVRTEPVNVPVTGGTVSVVAAIFDAAGNPVINTPVTFAVDFGTLSANVATTDGNGEARVLLTTNRTTKVTVTAGSKTGEFNLAALNPPSVTLSCGSTNTANVGVPVSCTITPTVSGNGSSSAPIQNVTINWGDGTGEQPLGIVTGATVVSHTYSSPGSFQVLAAATDANSQRGQAIVTLNVTRAIPTISISASASTGSVGVPVSFTVTPPSNPTIPTTGVTVDFGDGSSRNLGAITAATTVTRTYSSTGSYVVSATITDAAGGRNTASTAVQIGATAAPTVTLTQTGTLSGGCGTFTVSATAATGVTISSVTVRQSDSSENIYSGSTGSTFVRCGLAVNNILVATATDSLGQQTTATLLVK